MSKLLIALLASSGLAVASVAGAQSLTKEQYEAKSEQFDSAYKADKERCDKLGGNAKDICQAEAKAKRDSAKADAEAQMRNTADARRDAAVKKAEANYDVEKEKCDDLSGDAKNACQKDARAKFDKAKADAKMRN
jgi:hypothetical protein